MTKDPETTTTLEEARKVGYLGTKVDPTPNENYTVAGVTSGKPTPETDAGLRQEALGAADATDEEPKAKRK